MSALAIDKHVPIPEPTTGGRPRVHDWHKLEPGDSAVVMRQATAKYAVDWARKNGRKFTTRKDPRGWRVWRIE